MTERFARTKLLIGQVGVQRLQQAKVAVFGAGGVGSYAVEALARSGIGKMDIIDGDRVSLTNLNRQLIALESTIGLYKAETEKRRIADINPDAQVNAINLFYSEETAGAIDFSEYDYVIDAVDTVAAKLLIIEKAKAAGTRVITCMGAGNKMDPMAFRAADINQTSVCPLARVMRRELKRRGISGVKAVYSEESPLVPLPGDPGDTKGTAGRPVPGSMAFVPSAAGLLLCAEVVKDLLKDNEKKTWGAETDGFKQD